MACFMIPLSDNQVAILAGGRGTRLAGRYQDLPKPMVPVFGKPILEHQINLCRRFGFYKIALLVQHQSEVIRRYFGNGEQWGVRLRYSEELSPRGTAGALADSIGVLADEFLVLYADTYADIDLQCFYNKSRSFKDTAGCLLVHPNDHPFDSDLVKVDEQGQVHKIISPSDPEASYTRNIVNAALYYLKKDSIGSLVPKKGRFDIAKDLFPKMLSAGLRLQTYSTPEYIKDMGTPDRLDKVERDIKKGLPELLSRRGARSAVFIDRDGTINREVGHLKSPDCLELINGSSDAVRDLNKAGVLAVCITNQPVLARGEITASQLERIHGRLDYLLGNNGAYLSAIYVCPHHPDKGFKGEVKELKIKCGCRKPNTGLIDKAIDDLIIDRRSSWMVGDTTSDLLAGKRAGCKTVLVRTGQGGQDGKYNVFPDFIFANLKEAVNFIIGGYNDLVAQLLRLSAKASASRLILIGGLDDQEITTVAAALKSVISEAGRQIHRIKLIDDPGTHRLSPAGGLNSCNSTYITSDVDCIMSVIRSKTSSSIAFADKGVRRQFPCNDSELLVGPSDLIIVYGSKALVANDLVENSDLIIIVRKEGGEREPVIETYEAVRTVIALSENSFPDSRSEKVANRVKIIYFK
jgi:D,D-heptose 1,7-bisphosphate phosphatase